MNERKLTPLQIGILFDLCNTHEMIYYDVQVEMVDHIATMIEERWKMNPENPFEEAVSSVLEQFGGEDGLWKITKSKEKALKRKYTRVQLKYIAEFFRLPKIILTFLITLTLFFIYKVFNNDTFVTECLQGIFVALIFYWELIFQKKIKFEIEVNISFLFYNYFWSIRSRSLTLALIFPTLINFINQKILTVLHGNYHWIIVAFTITLIGFWAYTIGVYIPRRIKEDFKKEFPQFVRS